MCPPPNQVAHCSIELQGLIGEHGHAQEHPNREGWKGYAAGDDSGEWPYVDIACWSVSFKGQGS